MPKAKEEAKGWEGLPENIRQALVNNQIGGLKPEERIKLYEAVCEAKGLDPAGRPFEFISFQGKTQMYARRECTDQLREIHGISTEIVSQEIQGDVYVVHIRARDKEGRSEDDIGATAIAEPEYIMGEAPGENGKVKAIKKLNPRFGKAIQAGELANQIMKAVTKGKRRATLSICGLGVFDESEIETMRDQELAVKAPTFQEVQEIAAKVKALREQAAKGPKAEREELIRQACALEEAILNLEGSGHTQEPEQKAPVAGAGGSPEPKSPKEEPKPQPKQPEAEKPAPQAPEPEKEQEAEFSEEPAGEDWRKHVLKMVKNPAFEGKEVGSLEKAMLAQVYKGWVLKFPERIAADPDKMKDAAAIKAACQFHGIE